MRALPLLAVGLVAATGLSSTLEAQIPQIPATFYGAVTVDGAAPPVGTQVRAFIDGMDCTQPGEEGTIVADGAGAYAISVMHETQQSGCGREGRRVTFLIGEREARQWATWRAGVQELGLNAGAGEVQPLPTSVATPTSPAAAQPTAAVMTPTPTDDIEPPASPSTQTPLPPGLSTEGREDEGRPVWLIVVGALLGLGVVSGAAGYALSRRRDGGEGEDSPQG